MKGKTVRCLEEMVKTRHGREKWTSVLLAAGRPADARFTSTEVVPPGDMLRLLEACAAVLELSLGQAIDQLEEYWRLWYAPLFNGISFQRSALARDDAPVRFAA